VSKSIDIDVSRPGGEGDAADGAGAGSPAGPPDRPVRPVLPSPDRHQVEPLNQLWHVLSDRPVRMPEWRRRLMSVGWRLFAPAFKRQQEFNAVLVDHLNRQIAHDHAVHDALNGVLRFVESKHQLIERQLAAALDSMSDATLRHSEAAVAREQRFSAQVAALSASYDELRMSLASAHQLASALRHEIEQRLDSPAAPGPGAAPAAAERGPAPLDSRIDSGKYVGFEDFFRGAPEVVAARLAEYVPLFAGAADVLDLGCGRGEFLDQLAANGIRARGVDLNPEMAESCRARGLDVVTGDGLLYLASLPDGSLGGLFAAQVVEHLQPDQLVRLLEVAFEKLRPGACLVLETINPACWYAFFSSYIRDITHVRPLHPDTLRYLLLASGFQRVEISYRQPYPEQDKLQQVPCPSPGQADPNLGDLVGTVNENVNKLNALLFTYQDYAVIGHKL
jgi:SAM-dependent methyltransferase